MKDDSIKLTDAQEREMLKRELDGWMSASSSNMAYKLMQKAIRTAMTAARGLQSLRLTGRAAGVDYNEG